METKINEKLLEKKLSGLKKESSWNPGAIEKLESLIRSGDDFTLFRINPLKFGIDQNIPESEVVDVFLYSARAGIFVMNWQLLCPMCGDVIESFSSLKTLNRRYHCDLCRSDFEAALDDFIEISFTVSPKIREISFHDPGSLSVEDYFFKYVFSQNAVYADGTKFTDIVKDAVRVITYLEPKEKKRYELELAEGYLEGCDRLNNADLFFEIAGEPKTEIQSVDIKLIDRKFEPNEGKLNPGKVVFEFENLMDRKGSVFIIYNHLPPDVSGNMLSYEPFLSGKKLLTTQTFRDLFGSEIIKVSEGIGIKDITILFTDLKGSTELYNRIGDLNAFSLVNEHFNSLGTVVNRNSVAIVKTIGDAIMATFLNPYDAIKAALEMLEEIENLNQRLEQKAIILKIGIHSGPSIAVTLNERLDYFGETVNVASRVQNLCDGEDIYISQDVYYSFGVKELLKDFKISLEKARLKGISEEMEVYKINH